MRKTSARRCSSSFCVRRGRSESPEHEKAWIVRTTSNACKDLLRNAFRRTSVALDAAADAPAPETAAPDSVLRQVMALPQNYREAIYLHYYEGYSVREIAELTGRSEAAVAAHLSRGGATSCAPIWKERTMNGGYKKAMDGIRFSEAAKERMARNLVAAQGASHAPAASATRQARERTPVRARAGGKRRWQAVAAAAAAVGVLAVLGGAAYASGALMTMAEAVDAAFTGAPTPTEIVDKVGRPVGAGASSNGVTVTAEAIFGDRENYAIVYSIAKDDGTAFDLPPKTDSGTLPLRFQEGSPTASVSGTRSASGTAYFYDADPADNAIQYVERTSVNQDGGSVIGKTARAHFGNLCEAESGNMVAPGDWNIKFVIDYEDLATSIPAGQTFHLDGMGATVDSLELSPVARRQPTPSRVPRTGRGREAA